MRNKGQTRHAVGTSIAKTLVDRLIPWGRSPLWAAGCSPLQGAETAAFPIPPSRRTKKTFTAWADKDARAQISACPNAGRCLSRS